MKNAQNIDLSNLEIQVFKKRGSHRYINLACGFDIETTSTIQQGQKIAFMYAWAVGFNDGENIYYGRTWEDLQKLINYLRDFYELDPDEKRLIIYVQNLGYEFQFMRKYFNFVDVFAPAERKPLYAVIEQGIEFRCSLMLSGFSLAKMGENLTRHNIKKLVGDLDYNLIRHHKTPLTAPEWEYLKNDVEIIIAYINEELDRYKKLEFIPMTNTGRVRKLVTNNCYYINNKGKKSKGKFLRYRKIIEPLTITVEEYKDLKNAFQGGFTHANARYFNKTLENVYSVDFTSSYPAVMLMEKFPMSAGIETNLTTTRNLKYYAERYCLTIVLKFKNIISSITQDNYISESRCSNLKNAIVNNGRIHSADEIYTVITDVDLEIISACYSWEEMEVIKVTRYTRGYLPKDIIKSVIDLYQDKTLLKGVDGKEVEYMHSKGMLNSIYGMCVTDISRDEIKYSEEWSKQAGDTIKQIAEYNDKKTRSLSYAWGVWITAYSRRNLWSGIFNIGEDYIYSDTDSIKLLNYDNHLEYFKNYDLLVNEKLNAMCKTYNLDPRLCSPDGKTLGVWDFEGTYSRFKTLGAKRYIVEENGKIKITVAGLGKKQGADYIQSLKGDAFNNFDNDLFIPEDKTGKLTHSYFDEPITLMIKDYKGDEQEVHTRSGIHLGACSFSLSISAQYAEFITNLKQGLIYTGQEFI